MVVGGTRPDLLPSGPGGRLHQPIGVWVREEGGRCVNTGLLPASTSGNTGRMVETLRRLALPIAITSMAVNVVMLILSCVIWFLAVEKGWIDSVEFVSHVSMLALVFSAVSGIAAGLAGILALVPTDDLLKK